MGKIILRTISKQTDPYFWLLQYRRKRSYISMTIFEYILKTYHEHIKIRSQKYMEARIDSLVGQLHVHVVSLRLWKGNCAERGIRFLNVFASLQGNKKSTLATNFEQAHLALIIFFANLQGPLEFIKTRVLRSKKKTVSCKAENVKT